MYEQGNSKNPCSLEQTLFEVEFVKGSIRLLRSFVWQKQRNHDGSRLIGVVICDEQLYGTIRYGNDTYGIEVIDKVTLATIQKLDLGNIKFNLSQQGRIDVSILATGNWLLIFQKVSSLKRLVIICQNNKVVDKREISKKDKFKSCITRIRGDFIYMIERKSSAVLVIQWKFGNSVLNKFKQAEINLPDTNPVFSFTVNEVNSAALIVTLTSDKLSAINIYEVNYDKFNPEQKVFESKRRLHLGEKLVCLFPSPQTDYILAINGSQTLRTISLSTDENTHSGSKHVAETPMG